jgi:HD superfamily phosphohydrolase
MKVIFDQIHKYMKFDNLLLKIIDTVEFQRLRNIKQLGLCYYVFPGASHNRFEHSLGVSYLSGYMIEMLKNKQPELNITERDILLVKIAGLIHDLGHVCFSHFFDNFFLSERIPNSEFRHHEYRSCKLFEFIVKKYKIDLSDEEIKIINRMINPDINDSFLYQIVCNKINGLDCDKFDYIVRDTYNIGLAYSFDVMRLIDQAKVINNKICFRSKCSFDISDLYYTRYKLHKQIYTHKVVRAIEYMILDIIRMLDESLNLVEKILDVERMSELTDNILDNCYLLNDKKCIKLLERIRTRDLYKMVYEGNDLNKDLDKVIIDNIKLNYSMNDKNPLNFVSLYEGDKIVNNNFLFLKPDKFEEDVIRVYIREKKDLKNIKEKL